MRFLLPVLLLILMIPYGAAAAQIDTAAKQAILIDFETGQVLFEKNPDERMATSSMSKVMTMLMVFEAIEDGRLALDDNLPISEKAWRKGGSKMFIEVGKEVMVEDLIRGVIVQSGNDASIALAEGLGGSEDNFAIMMNQKAAELGMENSNFRNASGWPDPDHYSTARDLAIMARHLISTYSDHYGYYSETEFTFNAIKQPNRNPLLYRDIGADGVKTGYTEAGGYGLIGSGERDGRRVVMVLNGMETPEQRAGESARLLDWALRNFENKTVLRRGQVLEQVPVVFGTKKQVAMVSDQDLRLSLPRVRGDALSAEISYDAPLTAPVAVGDRIGTLTLRIADQAEMIYPLVAAETVAEQGFLQKTFTKIWLALSGRI